jgi:hypothetical protein
MKRHDGASNLMVCENSVVRNVDTAWTFAVEREVIEPTCDLEPMYLV